jgi:predicted RNA-binding Zn ribbon-like protein
MSQINFGHYMECSLALGVDLVNTENPISGRDELTSPDALAGFLTEHSVSYNRRPTGKDLNEVLGLRATLRRVFEAPDEKAAARILNEMLADSGARPELTDHDGHDWHLHYTPSATPLAPRLAAESAMALTVVIAEEGFDRLQTCQSDTCIDVFVDQSRNRSRRYCSSDGCGNRASVAAYRARQKLPS